MVTGMSRVKEFPLPDLGEGLTEGEILKWLVHEGDMVTLNQPIVEVETAKAAVEIPAKWAGKVTTIFHPEGTTVEVGTPIIAIDTEPDAGPPSDTAPSDTAPSDSKPSAAALAAVEVASPEAPVEPGLIGGPAPGGRTAVLVGYGPKASTAKRRPRAAATPVASTPAPVGVLAKPPVRKLARDLGVDLTALVGTGPQGSITRSDVESSARPAPVVELRGGEQRIPVKGVRKLTAENMVASAFTAPHVTEFLTVDVTRGVRALERLRALPEWREVRVSPLLLAAKAVLVAIKRYPLVNSSWAETDIVVKDHVHLGIAAATERGLVVPNIKNADRLSLRELADAMTALVQTAKSGRTAPADLTGGTFSITNVGVFGVDTGTPILPPGEAAILVFGAIREMPWVHKGKVKVRSVTTLGLSFDHRIIDGEVGSKFLRDVGAFLSDPEAALLAWG
jgi:2-oxoisovalerate dehydrogenase E2 component (dihydrolipoyl transacylase)